MSKGKDLISIIVPVYNTEKYLMRCIRSIINQTEPNFEVILIDDGSKDGSGKLCDETAIEDKRFRVIHKANEGVSVARNVGLDVARGEYITFIDSDDYVEIDFLENLKKYLGSDIDMVICRHLDEDINGKVVYFKDDTHRENVKVIMADENFQYDGVYSHRTASAVLYKRNIIDNIRFEQAFFVGEDSLFFATVLKHSRKVIFISDKLYHYVQYEESAYHGKTNRKKLTELEAWNTIIEYYRRDTEIWKSAVRCYAAAFRHLYAKAVDRETQRILEEKLKTRYKDIQRSGVKGFIKLMTFCIARCPYIYLFLKKGKYAILKRKRNLLGYRIGIVTADDCTNFGNRLQNLAMQKLLSDMGYNVHTFHRNYSMLAHKTLGTYIVLLLGEFIFFSKKICGRAFLFQRIYGVQLFNNRYIKWDKHTFDDVCGTVYLEKSYDALIVGSDQVWNFQWDFNTKETLLYNVPSTIKKISVAASLGNTQLADREKELFQKYLNDFDAVSVREESAIPLLQPYYEGKIIQIKDPTLLVGRKYWKNMAESSRLQVKERYILLFFLGPVSKAVSDFCEKLRNCYHLQVIKLNDFRNPYYGIGPIDFLKMIHDAEYVLTDSFHCSVFSILFQKKISIYNRDTDEMDSSNRTDELLELFEMNDIKNIYSIDELARQIPQNEVFIDTILEPERRKAEEFVEESLGKGEIGFDE